MPEHVETFCRGSKSPQFSCRPCYKILTERHGNSIDLVDWAPTCHRLLLAEGAWEWGSELFGSFARIYDADSDTLSSGELIDRAFLNYIGRHGVAILRPVGFSANGNVVIGTRPYFDEGEESPNKNSCVIKEGLWQIDSAESAVIRLPDRYKVQHYGKESSGISPEVQSGRN